MAEGWTRYLKGEIIEVWSAGIALKPVDPHAVKVMTEAGVDISGQHSKAVDEVIDIPFNYVITVCSSAYENCPFFPGKVKRIHVGFDDPPKLALNAKSEEEALAHYRRIRDEIRAFVEGMPENLIDLSNK
jgi:arsenate reductase (thioredoxin)